MLRATMPHVQSWNSWYADIGNRPTGVAALRTRVDEACRDVGRDPAEVERTVAVLVRLPGGAGRIQGGYAQDEAPAVEGTPAEMAELLRGFAQEGIAHVQLVVDPITVDSIRALGPVLAELDRH
jgi:alkanesulfonate monooxygenase SsuD/methylene tetrahydromethanopterin reductase-like flavin-dependent oxidoreductase (luciferase family)